MGTSSPPVTAGAGSSRREASWSAIEFPDADEWSALDPTEREAMIAAIDRLRRRAEVSLAEGVAAIETSGSFRRDGHRTVSAWGVATANWSTRDSVRIARNGRVLRSLPVLAAAARSGTIGVSQLDDLGRVHANPRCAVHLVDVDEVFTGLAARHWHADFAAALLQWQVLADVDGAFREHAVAHEGRGARVSIVGCEVVVEAHGGTADGVVMREILERFAAAEFAADCAQVPSGDGAASALARTATQRRFDALRAIFLAAAGSGVMASVDPLVNVVVDERTAAELLREAAGERVESPSPVEFRERHCRTADGVPLDRAAALAALLVGRLRRVVFDRRGVVVDLGRRSRLFRGSAAEAVELSGLRCLWPGCAVPSRSCEYDHTVPWSADGTTTPHNAGLACAHHNRWKAQGYITSRDSEGSWHVRRPDGSELGARGREPP